MTRSYRYKYDLHVHSSRSYDCSESIESIIRAAKLRKIDGLAITDHNRLFPPLEAKRLSDEHGIHIIVGEEIKTDHGEILGLFLQEEISSPDYQRVIDSIHDQNGLAILPHPYRGRQNPNYWAEYIDAIEVINGKNRITQNIAARLLYDHWNKGKTCGSDAHNAIDVGRYLTLFRDKDEGSVIKAIKNGQVKIVGVVNSILTTMSFLSTRVRKRL